jgi:RND family efflux transporter MFP subunit
LEADVAVQQLPQRHFVGKVSRTAESLDANSRTLSTEVDVQNTDFSLLPGMYAEVTLLSLRSDPPLVVPGDALVIGADGIHVAVITGSNKVHLQKVEVGRDYGTETEVLAGLQGGEEVIVNPTDSIREGVAVKPASSQEKGSATSSPNTSAP